MAAMQFKFKIQQYQTDAAAAVTDVFEGQPNADSAVYVRDRGALSSVPSSRAVSITLGDSGGPETGYGNAPVALSSTQLLDNVRKVQRRNQIAESTELSHNLGAVQLDVEMETGTGKTYVYTKTMFELNKLYGWTKFIIVVPSIAIREGVYKSLTTTGKHFHDQYGKSINYFIYDSHQLGKLDEYSQSPDIYAMIINMQAFNTSMKEGGRSKEARIMYSERDEFASRRPIDVIAANHPIVIQDEPQKMGGKATQNGIKRFQPLFCLNYSATHKEKHNLVYELDALDAYNQRLVKRIEVKGFELKNMRGTDGYLYLQDILVTKNHEPQAVIEYKKVNASGTVRKVSGKFDAGDSIYDASGSTKLEAYRDFTIAPDGIVPDMDGRLGHVEFLNGVTLEKGQIYGDSAIDDMRRVQIRETIKSHLQKEQALFERGIKCLSLFFIDEVAKYRAYDEDGNELTVGYGKVFEEEYEREVARLLADENAGLSPEYRQYLESISAHETHRGYFSIDKKGHAVDSKIKRGSDESDDESAYDLILKNKERLLSFEEPTRFIFSHSALREGWDNPNIFQICTLKHSDSETGKRQEVGRGLRLCVDQNGDRQDAALLGEDEVQRVNVLTVIASESYADFTRALQSDIASGLHERPKSVTEDFFTGKTITLDGQEISFNKGESGFLHAALLFNGLIDDNGRPTEKFHEEGISAKVIEQMKPDLQTKVKAAEALVRNIDDPHALDGMIANGHADKVTENRLTDNFKKAEFQALWKQINHKHSYTVSFDENELRAKAIEAINENLQVSELSYALTVGRQKEQANRDDLSAKSHFDTEVTRRESVDLGAATSVTYDLLGEVAQAAVITRRSAAAILAGIAPEKFALYKKNPEEFIAKVGKLIVDAKSTMIVAGIERHERNDTSSSPVAGIEYHELDDVYDSSIFAERMPENRSRAMQVKKGVQRYVFPDSKNEEEFTEELEHGDEVVVYAKLPRTFQIPTPVGNYAPDWAIAFKKGSVKYIYFVAETKGSMNSLELRGVEEGKIECAKKLFNEINTSTVRYDVVNNYGDLLNLVK